MHARIEWHWQIVVDISRHYSYTILRFPQNLKPANYM